MIISAVCFLQTKRRHESGQEEAQWEQELQGSDADSNGEWRYGCRRLLTVAMSEESVDKNCSVSTLVRFWRRV